MHRLKPLFFVQLTLLSNNLVLSSYLNGILLRMMVFLAIGKSVESIEEQKETDEYEESQITKIHIFGFKLHFPRKYILKNSCLYLYTYIFIVFMCCRIFETQ